MVAGSKIAMRSQKGRKIVLGDSHEVTQTVGSQRAGLDPGVVRVETEQR